MKIKNMNINMETANKFFENLNKKDTIKFVTHHGLFHADDVCCAVVHLTIQIGYGQFTIGIAEKEL